MMKSSVFLELKEVKIYKGPKVTFEGLNWTIRSDENWAVVGPNGSGKTILAETIAGKNRVLGQIRYPFIGEGSIRFEQMKEAIAYVSFAEDSRLFSYRNHYYQQRFQAAEADEDLTAGQYLFGDNPPPDSNELLKTLELENLLDRHFIKLSNGQTRKLRLARALLRSPRLIILDQLFTGLDPEARLHLHKIVHKLCQDGIHLILIAGSEAIPEVITHVMEIRDFKVAGRYTRNDFVRRFKKQKAPGLRPKKLPENFVAVQDPRLYDYQLAIQMDGVNLSYGGVDILRHINWRVRKGEKWNLKGANGSGKTSLLSLIYADNPQAYGQNIVLFDRPKGSGESIWDIKQKIGFISPELHFYTRQNKKCLHIAATGFTDSQYLTRKITSAEVDQVRALFHFLEIGHLLERPFLQISTGEQRLVMIIRALVKNAPFLIMDEPFQGLDVACQQACKDLLSQYCHAERGLIFVSHFESEVPAFVDHRLELAGGRVVRGTVRK